MFHIAICDDEAEFIGILKEQLTRYEKETEMEFVISEFRDGSVLLENYKYDFDLIFMDIKMEKLDGLKTAEKIRNIDSATGLFFLTSLPQYVWKGYEYGAVNYLLKPLKYARLKMELDRFFSHYRGKEEPFIAFSNDSGKFKVMYRDIRFAETDKRNVRIHFDDQEQVIYKNMKEISSVLEKSHQFVHCHASFIVNLAYVRRIENMEVILTTGERIPVSQPKRKAFMNKLTDFWGDML